MIKGTMQRSSTRLAAYTAMSASRAWLPHASVVPAGGQCAARAISLHSAQCHGKPGGAASVEPPRGQKLSLQPPQSQQGRIRQQPRPQFMQQPVRTIYWWVENLFNAPDRSRLREVGPEKFAAEYVIRMGGRVQINDQDAWIEKDNLLSESMQLTGVSMQDSTVTPIGMEHFDGLQHLKHLDLSGNKQIDSASLSYVKSPVLETLCLRGVPVNDAAVHRLTQFRSLKELDVRDTGISPAGLDALRKGLPDCRIEPAKELQQVGSK